MSVLYSSSHSPDEIRLRDPLSEVTRKERRSLLGISIMGIAIAQAGLIPTEVSSLGVKLTQGNQGTLLLLLALVCSYYLVGFLAYAATDYVAWKVALKDSIVNAWMQPQEVTKEPETQEEAYRLVQRSERLEEFLVNKNGTTILAELLVLPVSRVRAVFEFLLPLFVACYAIAVLLWRSVAP